MLERGSAQRLDLTLQVAVFEPRTRRAAQAQRDGRDDDLAAQRMLEEALAVAEAAVRGIHHQHVARLDAEHLDALERILHLAAVGPDVLHRRGPRLAGNEREVLQAPEPPLDAPGHQRVPLDARLDAQPDRAALLAERRDALAHRAEEHPLVVTREEYVVAAAEDVPLTRRAGGEEFAQLVRRLEFNQTGSRLRDVETVAVAQVDMLKFSNHDVQS